MQSDKKKVGAPRKYDYIGKKRVTSIRLSEYERELILLTFDSVQEFIQYCVEELEKQSP